MPSNPYMGRGNAVKATPPPAPPAKRAEETRASRMGLDTFIYHCHKCGKDQSHSTGYIFVTRYQGEELYFCDINCCDAWEKGIILKPQPPAPDRRGAVLATREKNEENDSRA